MQKANFFKFKGLESLNIDHQLDSRDFMRNQRKHANRQFYKNHTYTLQSEGEDKQSKVTFGENIFSENTIQGGHETNKNSLRIPKSQNSDISAPQKGKKQNSKFFKQKPFRKVYDKKQIKRLAAIKNIAKQFKEKACLNSQFRQPLDYDPLEPQFIEYHQYKWLSSIISIKMSENGQIFISIFKVLYFILYILVYPLSILYSNISVSWFLLILKILGLAVNLFNIFEILRREHPKDQYSNVTQYKMDSFNGQKKAQIYFELGILCATTLSIIFHYYDRNLSCAFFMAISLYFMAFFKDLEILQEVFIKFNYINRYWSLIKVVAFIFFACHILSCILIATTFYSDTNWMIARQINKLYWIEQYIWSYYFGITIVLTIGFGDFHAQNSLQAVTIIMVSIFSCLFFGYNINYIGIIINSIKEESLEKNNKLKILNGLAKKTPISKQVKNQISQFIHEEYKLKHETNQNQQKKLINQLPQALKSTLLQQINQKIFNNLNLILPLRLSTIQRISQKIEAKVYHPQQLIKKASDPKNILILQAGQVGFMMKQNKFNKKFKNIPIQRIKNTIQQQSKIICLNLLSNNEINYQIKALDYSIIYQISKQQFQQQVREQSRDFELYRQMLDTFWYKINSFPFIKCRFCQNKMHSAFQCPKLHYSPFKNVVPLKYLKNKRLKQERVHVQRKKNHILNDTIIYRQANQKKSQLNQSKPTINTSIKGIQASLSLHSLKCMSLSEKTKHKGSLKSSNCLLIKNDENNFLAMQMVIKMHEDIQILKKTAFQSSCFSLWENTDCDLAHNFKFYFTKLNPERLSFNLNLSKNLKQSATNSFIRMTSKRLKETI